MTSIKNISIQKTGLLTGILADARTNFALPPPPHLRFAGQVYLPHWRQNDHHSIRSYRQDAGRHPWFTGCPHPSPKAGWRHDRPGPGMSDLLRDWLELGVSVRAVYDLLLHHTETGRRHLSRAVWRRPVKIPLYDQGTVIYVILPDDADPSRMWVVAEAGLIKVEGEKK